MLQVGNRCVFSICTSRALQRHQKEHCWEEVITQQRLATTTEPKPLDLAVTDAFPDTLQITVLDSGRCSQHRKVCCCNEDLDDLKRVVQEKDKQERSHHLLITKKRSRS